MNTISKSSVTLLLLLPIYNYAQTGSQEQDNDKVFHKRYLIKPGQKLYTKDSKNMVGLKAYSKQTTSNVNEQSVIEIETGDYENKQIVIDGKKKNEKGDFMIYRKTITGSGVDHEVKYEIGKKEFVKKNKIALDIDSLEFGEKTIKFKMLWGIKPETGKIAYMKNSDSIVNSGDNSARFYWKLEEGEQFSYHRRAFSFGAVSLPFKIRFGKESDSRPATVETGLENVGLYIGKRYSSITYKNSSFSYLHFTLGAFAGPQKITINKDNSKGVIAENINRLGVTSGLLFSVAAGNLNLGIASGLDFLGGAHKDNWVYNRKIWLGFAVGYKISIL